MATVPLPASGTATYATGGTSGDWLEYQAIAYNDADLDLKLTADFAKRAMSAKLSLTFQDETLDALVRPNLSGTGSIAPAGSFAIPLSGVWNSTSPNSDPATGSISGALFGPGASEVGGTFTLLHSGEAPLTASFIGVRQ